MIHTVKSYGIVNEAKVDVFLEFPCFFYDLVVVGNLISGSSDFSKPSLYIWKFTIHVLLKPSLKDFKHYLASMWDEPSCTVVWAFFGIALLWDWNKNWPFPLSIRSSKFSYICTVAEYPSFLTPTFHLCWWNKNYFESRTRKNLNIKFSLSPTGPPPSLVCMMHLHYSLTTSFRSLLAKKEQFPPGTIRVSLQEIINPVRCHDDLHSPGWTMSTVHMLPCTCDPLSQKCVQLCFPLTGRTVLRALWKTISWVIILMLVWIKISISFLD